MEVAHQLIQHAGAAIELRRGRRHRHGDRRQGRRLGEEAAVWQAHEEHWDGPVEALRPEDQVARLVERAVDHARRQQQAIEITGQPLRELHGHLVLHRDHRRHARCHQLRP